MNINNRIKYSFPYNGTIYVKPLTSTVNYIVGRFDEQPIDSAGILIKISMDSIVWAIRYNTIERHFDIYDPNLLPNGNTVFTSGKFGDTNSCSLTCISPNGNILWAKKMAVNFFNTYLSSGSYLTISNNAIYFLGMASSFFVDSNFSILAKLDFNGNILWSKAFGNSRSKAYVGSTPLLLQGDTLISVDNIQYYGASSDIDSVATVFTTINASTGTLLSSIKLKTSPDNFIKGIYAIKNKIFTDNSITISGQMAMSIPLYPGRIFPISGIPFTARLSKDLTTIKATYLTYNNNLTFNFDAQNFYTEINTNKETGYLLIDENNPLGYFVSLDSNAAIKRSRVFRPLSTGFFLDGSFHYDNAATFYYSFPFNPNLHQTDLEYSRISNMAEANTVDCFGIDTLVTTPHSFTMPKDTFLWDSQYQNILTSNPVIVSTATFTINQLNICTQTSICDTLKLKGNTLLCPNINQVFTVYKNPRCLLKTKWIIDTSQIKIVSEPNDTTIILNFIKPYHGSIGITLDGCTLKDSLYINTIEIKTSFSLNKDSFLCNGKNLILQASKGFALYNWQDGSHLDNYTVTDTGFYKVAATDSCGKIFNDSIYIKFSDTLFPVPSSALICNTDTFKLQVPSNFTSVTLLPSSSASSLNKQILFYPLQATSYTITATTNGQCPTQKNILINVNNCAANIFFPNAFSPNGTGSNNFFKPFITLPLQQYQLIIYNRFGLKIFESNNPLYGWDGSYKSTPQNSSTFIYYCSYKFFNKPTAYKKGYCTLIR